MMLTTGILISGKMSVAMRISTSGVDRKISNAITINVYGRRKASLTIHISYLPFIFEHPALCERDAGSCWKFLPANSCGIGQEIYRAIRSEAHTSELQS